MRSHLLLWDAERRDPVPYAATLAFDKNDPYAVELLMQVHDGGQRRIVFARELLIDGLGELAGEPGVVRVEPHLLDMYVTFTLPIDGALREFYAERAPVDVFVGKTCSKVPLVEQRPLADADLDRWLEAIA